MGKKTKKTRWRALSIGETYSDSESQNGVNESTKVNYKYTRTYGHSNGAWHNNSTNREKDYYSNGSNKFSSFSSNSTPIKHQNSGNYHQRSQWNGYCNRNQHQETSKSTTRSSSTVSEHKIIFNEDEYTRITTPRQDVLFKKGYLSKPKPHLQQQRILTSTGNSTGDGTPDHSADGNEIVDADYEQSSYIFSGPNSYMDVANTGMLFVNGFEPYSLPPQHLFVYDQYGNAAVCFPPGIAPHHLPPPPSVAERRAKRYSTDSLTESTSPHNESNQDSSNFNDPDESFILVNDIIIKNNDETLTKENNIKSTESDDGNIERKNITIEVEIDETKPMRKKRRRKKTDHIKVAQQEHESLSDLSSLSDDESETNEEINNTIEKGCSKDEIDTIIEKKENTSCKYRVDAEEFIPRSYRNNVTQIDFVPIPVGMPYHPELYAGAFIPATMFVPPPQLHNQVFYNNLHHNNSQNQQIIVNTVKNDNDKSDSKIEEDLLVNNDIDDKQKVELEEENISVMDVNSVLQLNKLPEEPQKIDISSQNNTAPIDIAKIVSKLEQAALEQKQIDQIAQTESKPITIDLKQDHITEHKEKVIVKKQSQQNKKDTNNKTEKKTNLLKEKLKLSAVNKIDNIIQQDTITNDINNVRYSERLKQPLVKPVSKLATETPISTTKSHQEQKRITKNALIQPKRSTVVLCPRLERNSRNNINNTNLTTTKELKISTNNSNNTVNLLSDQWISVSGKKKRGKNKQIQSDIDETFDIVAKESLEETKVNKVTIEKDTNYANVTIPDKQIESNDIVKDNIDPLPDANVTPINDRSNSKRDTNNKEHRAVSKNTQNSNSKVTTKKRIIITDRPLLNTNEQQHNQVEKSTNHLGNTNNKRSIENITDEQTVVIKNSLEKCETEVKEIHSSKSTKKKKKNKSKCGNHEIHDNINTNVNDETFDISITNNSSTIEELESKETENIDVSLELDRMIQRGLYGNLEQRLRSFNPKDSFIMDVLKPQENQHGNLMAPLKTISTVCSNDVTITKHFNTNANSIIGTMAATVLKKPSIFSQTIHVSAPKTTDTSEENSLLRKNIVRTCSESSTISESSVVTRNNPEDDDSIQQIKLFPITRAVKEWMNKTRENTPEIEIFKKPNEIRQEFLIVPNDNDDNDDEKNDKDVSVTTVEINEKNVPTGNRFINVAAYENIESTEDDLLDCWESDVFSVENKTPSDQFRRRKSSINELNQQPLHQQQQQHPNGIVEQGEDALEIYESIYGRSDDFGRIQREILAQKQQHNKNYLLKNNLSATGMDNNSLPYRAICCSIM